MFLEYGVNPHGELVHIEQAGRGLTNLFCPYCNGQLLARKGDLLIHHFAHAGETCRQVTDRQDYALRLPIYDKFDLGLSPAEIRYLHALHHKTAVPGGTVNLSRLEDGGFIVYNDFRYADDWELTHLGKIPVGAASLQKFAEIQLERQLARHEEMERVVRSAWQAHRPLETALTDLQIYRAQVRRVFAARLYFLEIKHTDGVLYKIGITNRDIEERMDELRRDITGHLSHVIIKPLRSFAHRGGVEFYFKHRYKAHQHRLGSLTEYFAFADRRQVLSDLSRMGDYEPDSWIVEILIGEPSSTEKEIQTQLEAAQRQAEAQAAQEAHRQATRAGMQLAAERGKHLGRPAGSVENEAHFLAKYPDVVERLECGESLRRIASETGTAINTVRKVKVLLDRE